MALKRSGWAGIFIGIGATIMSSILFSPELDKLRFYSVVIISGTLYSISAYLLGALKKAPFPIGNWLKRALVLGLIYFATWGFCDFLWKPPRSHIHILETDVLLDGKKIIASFVFENDGKIEIKRMRHAYAYKPTVLPRLSATEEDARWEELAKASEHQQMVEGLMPVGEKSILDLSYDKYGPDTISLLMQQKEVLYLMYFVKYEDEYGEQEKQYCGIYYRWTPTLQRGNAYDCIGHNQDK